MYKKTRGENIEYKKIYKKHRECPVHDILDHNVHGVGLGAGHADFLGLRQWQSVALRAILEPWRHDKLSCLPSLGFSTNFLW